MSRRKKGDKIDGWVVLDKPVGLGSTRSASVDSCQSEARLYRGRSAS